MSLVTLDWMMSKAEQQGLRFGAAARADYRSRHAFADRLYDPRAGLGVFYRWKPRNVKQLCARKGIPVPTIHVSVLERIIQAPEGYAPGNLPPDCSFVTTEADPLLDVAELADTVATAHGGRAASPLVEQQGTWVRVGLASYLTFIAGTVGALVTALAVGFRNTSGPGDVLRVAVPLLDTFPLSLITAVVREPLALSLMAVGLLLGYLLASVSDRHTSHAYSSFWHKHRPALRATIRRTPPRAPGDEEPC
jgi:hypothetical protein